MLKRTIKQTKETLDGSIKAGNNQERTDTLTEQVAILEEYLSKQVEGDELAALIEEVLANTGASTKKDMGRVMGELSPSAPAAISTRQPPPRSSAVSWASGNRQRCSVTKGLLQLGGLSSLNELKRPKTFRAT